MLLPFFGIPGVLMCYSNRASIVSKNPRTCNDNQNYLKNINTNYT